MSNAIHVLYAEDNPQDAELTRTHFARVAPDIDLEVVVTGTRCLARLAQQPFDLLLLDNHLPDMDGLDVLNLLRDEARTLPTVLITGTGDEDVVVGALHAGAADYVSKSDKDYLTSLPDLLRKQVSRHRQFLVDGDGKKRDWRILYIEPNAMDAELTANQMAAHAAHLQMHIVSSSREALELLAAGHNFNLVLADLRIPGMDAPELIQEVQHRGIEVPFIIITGKGDETTAVNILRLGAYDYIVKRPNYLARLPHAIDNALHRFQLDQTTRRLHAELVALNASLEQKVEARTARLNHEIEERKRVEAEVREREQRLQTIIQTEPECVKIVGAEGGLLQMNAAGLAMLEAASLEELKQRLLLDFILPEYHEAFRALHQGVMTGKEGKLEFEIVGLKGTRRWLETHAAPLHDSSGKITSLLGITRDVTDRKRAEAEIRERERQLSTLIDNLPGLAYRSRNDADYTMEFVSDGIANLTGYPAEDFLQKRRPFGKLIHPDDQGQVWENIQVALQKGQPYELTYRILTSSGTEKWVWEKGQGIHDNQGQLIALEGFVTDITERRRDEAQLMLAAKVFEQSSEAFMITDAYRNIVMVNPAFTTITGYSEAEALGKSPRLLYSGKQDQGFYNAMWESINMLGHWQGEILDRRKDGTIYPKWLSISRVHDAQGNITHYIGIFSDISQHKRDEAHIQKLAHFDALTELPNRVLLNDRITLALSAAQRNRTSLAVMFVDLDHFKNVNDTLGHRIGDALLIEVAKRMKTVVREDDTVSRLGGDEFIFVLPGADVAGAAHVAEKLLEIVAQRYQIEQYELVITPSIGIAIYPNDGENFEALSQCADIAMYRAKRDGRNNYRFFTPEMQASSVRTLQLENALHHAIERDELFLHYQPQISLQDGHIIGAEALLRWRHPEFGLVSPAEFIPIAEDSGQILQIGEWVLRTAVRQLKFWMENGMPPMTMAVNLSVVQFRHLNLPDMVTQILEEVQLPPEYLELELTEGVAMDDPVGAIVVMDKLHQRGIRMSLDDFGTGYSSLNYLKRFKIYKLKIDQGFVRDITIDPDDKAIVNAVISLASSLGMLTIAEGVETEGQLAYLREQGCNEVQGYYFCHPLPADQLEAFIKNPPPGLNGKKKK